MSAPSSPARRRGLACIAPAAVSWGTTGAMTTLLVERAGGTPLVIGAARMAVAAAVRRRRRMRCTRRGSARSRRPRRA